MDAKKLDTLIKKATEKNPHPVLLIKAGHPSGKTIRPKRIFGVFEHWNGEQLFVSPRVRTDRKGKVWINEGFWYDEVYSVKAVSIRNLVDHANCLIDILEDIEKRKRELSNKR